MKRRKMTLAGILAAGALALTACSGGGGAEKPASGDSEGAAEGGSGGGGTIEFFFNAPTGSPQETAMKELVGEFEEQTGTKVDMKVASSGYEDEMKVRLASGDVPDVFATHGWSVLRYGQFLTPLEDQPWAEHMNEGLKDVMLDADGHLYAIPLEYGISGLIVNFDVLEANGIDPESISTWDGFNAAATKLKEAGITPIVSSGADRNSGDVGNFTASGQFTEEQNQKFASGEFDTALWQEGVSDHIQEWADNGWFNPDYVSATYDDMARQLAEGSAAFAFSWPFLANTALEFNPEVNMGFVPFPGPEGFLVGGEGVTAFGVAKDSKNPQEALDFLTFLAEPANAERLLGAQGAYSGLTNVNVDVGKIAPSYEKYVAPGTVPVKPFFDRVYLPNGMWDSIITTTDAVINKQMTSEQAAKAMQEQFNTLYAQAQESE